MDEEKQEIMFEDKAVQFDDQGRAIFPLTKSFRTFGNDVMQLHVMEPKGKHYRILWGAPKDTGDALAKYHATLAGITPSELDEMRGKDVARLMEFVETVWGK